MGRRGPGRDPNAITIKDFRSNEFGSLFIIFWIEKINTTLREHRA
jgi:hypothetical protein